MVDLRSQNGVAPLKLAFTLLFSVAAATFSGASAQAPAADAPAVEEATTPDAPDADEVDAVASTDTDATDEAVAEEAEEDAAVESDGAQAEAVECVEGEEEACLETDEDCVETEDGACAETDEDAEDAADEEAVDAPRDWGRFQPVADVVDAGGPIIIILAVLSILSLGIIVVKVLQFFAMKPGDHKFAERVAGMLSEGDFDGALKFLSRRNGVVARVMETALRGRQLGADEAQVREEVERVARVKLDGLEAGLPFLSLIATISPLLGLLGTVLGMIEAFQQLESAGDRVDPAILSGGIWEALLTTAAGLSVAIPAAAFYTWLQRTVDVAGQHMEDAATRVFTADIYSQKGAASRRRKAENENEDA